MLLSNNRPETKSTRTRQDFLKSFFNVLRGKCLKLLTGEGSFKKQSYCGTGFENYSY